jgi:hypothetical protein
VYSGESPFQVFVTQVPAACNFSSISPASFALFANASASDFVVILPHPEVAGYALGIENHLAVGSISHR